ncbi:MAG: TIGR03936 family radical SAM-associated protein [Eubacteriales bacterium]|nr:TIGR03936 family radical SAM-associated protein [Eubacteriales bacterium]
MKNVRVWFKKDDECRYISHLDLNRVMIRAIVKSRLPVWHTEGFNVHPYITFALPLSLGFRGEKETMDMRILDDNFKLDTIKEELNKCLPHGLTVFDVTEPVSKPGAINSAKFKLRLSSDDISAKELYIKLTELLDKDEILVEKKTKKGVKNINIKEYFTDAKHYDTDNEVVVRVVLPAGSTTNINPTLLIKALSDYSGVEVYYDITRVDVFDAEGRPFE